MTRAGKIQNYLGEEPGVWTGSNGATTLATRLVAPLRPFSDRFSVLNGVYMTPELRRPPAEHELPVLGQPVRRRFLHPAPQLGRDRPRRRARSMPCCRPRPCSSTSTTIRASCRSSPTRSSSWRERLREAEPPRADDKLGRFIRSRLTAGASGEGRMAAGARLMLSSLDQAPDVHRKLAALRVPREDLGAGGAGRRADRRMLPPVPVPLRHLRAARAVRRA